MEEKIRTAVKKVFNFRDCKKIYFGLAIFSLVFASFGFLAPQAGAATLYFSPSTGSYKVGQSFAVSIIVSSSDKAMNAADGVLYFSGSKISITSITKTGSIANLWAEEPSFSNSGSSASFAAVVLNPGYTGGTGKILTITFKAIAEGEAEVGFNSSSVLANDGEGTNILTGSGKARFTILPAVAEAPAPEAPIGLPGKPVVSSETHPDENSWYNKENAKFSWDLPAGVNGVSLYFSKSPTSNPGNTSDGALRTKEFEDVGEGVNYFHIKYRNSAGWGPIAHRKIQTDLTPPKGLAAGIIGGEKNVDGNPTVTMSAKDDLSGMDYFEVSANGSEPVKVQVASDGTAAYKFEKLLNGNYLVLVRAVDRAGNASQVVVGLTVEAPVIEEEPKELCAFTFWGWILSCWTLVWILLIIILILLLWILYLTAKMNGWGERFEDYRALVRQKRKQRQKEKERKQRELRRSADIETVARLRARIEEIEQRMRKK